MTRVVRDLEGRVVTSNRRQAVDSYARPYYHVHNSIRSIATALERWNPVFINRARQAEQQKWNREVEEGKAIAMQYAGKDYTLDQIEADIKAGNGGRYVALSKAQKEGINQLQLEQGLNNVSLKMQEAYDSATFKDVDGKEHRLYEAKDPMAFQKWFDEKYNELWESETGGVYDRSLYGELGSRHRAQSRNNLYSQFLSARGEMKSREADLAATQVLDTHFSSVLDKAGYIGNSKALGDMRAVLNRVANERDLVGSGGEGGMLATNYLLMKMGEATHNQEVQFLLNSAKGVTSIWDKPAYRSKLENYAQQKEKQFEAEAWQRETRAYQREGMALGRATRAEQWMALRATQTARAVAQKYLDANGLSWNEVNQVANQIMTDPAIAKNSFNLTSAQSLIKSLGNNLPLMDELSRRKWRGEEVDLKPYIDSGQLSANAALAIDEIGNRSDYKDKAQLYNYMYKSLDPLFLKVDATIADPQDFTRRESALHAAAAMATDSMLMQYNGQPINIASTDFIARATQAVKDAATAWGPQEKWDVAYQQDNFLKHGEITRIPIDSGKAKQFLATSGVLADPEVSQEVRKLIASHGTRLPVGQFTPYGQEQQKRLADKGYQFNNVPVQTFNDLCAIVHGLSTEDWAALVAGLNPNGGGTSGNRSAQ